MRVPHPPCKSRMRLTLAAVAVISLLFAATAGARAKETRLLVLGDSLAAGYGLAQSEAFPARLEAALHAEERFVKVIGAGVSGDTSAGGRARLEWTLGERPDAVIVELGANDGLRGIPPEETRRNLDAVLTRLKKAGIPVLLAGMRAPPNLGREYGEAFAAVYRDLARAHDVIFYPFFLDGVAAVPRFNQSDGNHPNADGVNEIVRRMLPAVRRLIDRVG